MNLRRPTLTIAIAAVAGASAAGLVVTTGSGAGPAAAARPAASKPAAEFRHALAAKLGRQLNKPAGDVLAAMRAAAQERRGGKPATRADRRARRADRLAGRADRLGRRLDRLRARLNRVRAGRSVTGNASAAGKAAARNSAAASKAAARRERARKARDAWAAAVAKPLGVTTEQVVAALRALVAERLDSLVADQWLTAERRDALLACYDDAAKCQGAGRVRLGIAFLRAGL